MTDYIKREDAIKAVIADAKLKNLLTGNCENEKAIEGMVYGVLCPRDIPSADVVEVVRCKDCKYKPKGYEDEQRGKYPIFPDSENNPCPCNVVDDDWYSYMPEDDYFCGCGKRAES